ncbi:MAG: 2-oxoglutarate synthase subunit KorB [Candidatus Heimdallarchaeota archaeon LC_3]|nr:MAG: 2-oxoglutarate synthase subunit KorB [Candidatus Heimdallarchaeota archaeon LC_3]
MTFTIEEKDLTIKDHPVSDYIRTDRLPWIFCQGCLIGSEIQLLARAMKNLVEKGDIVRDDILVVSGIGCSGRGSGYFQTDSFHTTHGRSVPFAVGAKMANPKLKVIVFAGDGDLFAIGGNHIIHAARRNIDITVICINNSTYGMTGGQGGPTTPIGTATNSTPWGNFAEIPFNLVNLTAASGATYVARWTSLHTKEAIESMEKAIMHKGFSFIEFLTPCPTYFGKFTGQKTGLKMLKDLQEKAIVKMGSNPFEATIDYDTEIICGEFATPERPEYTASYEKLREHALKENGTKKKVIDTFKGTCEEVSGD